MEPVSNLGRFGRFLMLTVGFLLLALGIFFIIYRALPDNTKECTAVITGFDTELSENTDITRTYTLVSYQAEGKSYENIALGQYEASWQIGDKITVCYDPDFPSVIKTKTMRYGGFILILFSMPFIVIGFFTIITRRRKAAKSPQEIAEDEERTTAGKLKYKVSSIVIPLSSGIPIFTIGIIFQFLEHNSAFGFLFIILGAVSVIVGLRSIVLYFIIKYRHRKKKKQHSNVV